MVVQAIHSEAAFLQPTPISAGERLTDYLVLQSLSAESTAVIIRETDSTHQHGIAFPAAVRRPALKGEDHL
jgi:hypothetical protein